MPSYSAVPCPGDAYGADVLMLSDRTERTSAFDGGD